MKSLFQCLETKHAAWRSRLSMYGPMMPHGSLDTASAYDGGTSSMVADGGEIRETRWWVWIEGVR